MNKDKSLPSLKSRWADGDVTLGAWFMMPGALGVEVVCNFGFDWIAIDMQHGCMDYETTVEMIRAADLAGVNTIIRVPENDPAIIGRVLDAGAMGIIVPMIETADDARRMVDACRYPPLGKRSFGPVRVTQRDGMGYGAVANEQVIVIPMIETASALENVDEIASIDEVDAIFVGPFDLSIALGLVPGDNDGDPVFDAAIKAVIASCQQHNKTAAVLSTAEVAPLRVSQGFQMVSVTTDFSALAQISAANITKVREAINEDNNHA